MSRRAIKLYTKKGDKGFTSLYDTTRIGKGNTLLDCLGDVDELSAHVGMLCDFIGDSKERLFLRKIQIKLFNIGAIIATTSGNKQLPEIKGKDVTELETKIDMYQNQSFPLRDFIIPGTSKSDAQAHICRSICRRAERSLNKENNIPPLVLAYMNRLSDFFFAYARSICRLELTVKAMKIMIEQESKTT